MTFATLAIGAACWFGPAWISACPLRANAAWPSAGHTLLDTAAAGAPRPSSPAPPRGDAAGEDEGNGQPPPRTAAIATITTSRPAIESFGVGLEGGRAGWRL